MLPLGARIGRHFHAEYKASIRVGEEVVKGAPFLPLALFLIRDRARSSRKEYSRRNARLGGDREGVFG